MVYEVADGVVREGERREAEPSCCQREEKTCVGSQARERRPGGFRKKRRACMFKQSPSGLPIWPQAMARTKPCQICWTHSSAFTCASAHSAPKAAMPRESGGLRVPHLRFAWAAGGIRMKKALSLSPSMRKQKHTHTFILCE